MKLRMPINILVAAMILLLSPSMFPCFLFSVEGKWKVVSTGEGGTFMAVHFFNDHDGIAITLWSIETTQTGGKVWTESIGDDSSRAYYGLLFVSDRVGFIVGGKRVGGKTVPLILRSEDGGKTWNEAVVPTDLSLPQSARPVLQDIAFCGPNVAWAAGDGVIFRSRDGGLNWENRQTKYSEAFYGIACEDSEHVIAVGRDGLIVRTTDGGISWDSIQSPSNGHNIRIRINGNDGWIVGGLAEKGVLLRSYDAGQSWKIQDLPQSEFLVGILLKGKSGWIVGVDGTILQTSDGGETWSKAQSPTKNALGCIFVSSNGEVWIAGDKRTLLRFY